MHSVWGHTEVILDIYSIIDHQLTDTQKIDHFHRLSLAIPNILYSAIANFFTSEIIPQFVLPIPDLPPLDTPSLWNVYMYTQ